MISPGLKKQTKKILDINSFIFHLSLVKEDFRKIKMKLYW